MEKDDGYLSAQAEPTAGSVSPPIKGGLWSRVRDLATIEVEESSYAPPGSAWSNKDLDPVPPELQTWRTVCLPDPATRQSKLIAWPVQLRHLLDIRRLRHLELENRCVAN